MLAVDQTKPRVAIVGAGPGGLLTAHYLELYGAGRLDISIFEATGRVGGKLLTPRMPRTGIGYEAGVAEIYDYSHLGHDPLKSLILELGLTITPMDGEAVVFEGQILNSDEDVRRHLGPASADRLDAFAHGARLSFTPENYYASDWAQGQHDPATRDTFAKLLDHVGDERVRRYVETVVHSDLATQPHKTSAAYGMQNWLMNEPEYMKLYSIDGGNERLVCELAKRLNMPINLNTLISHVAARDDGRYDITLSAAGVTKTEIFDRVVMALPVTNLSQITFVGHSLDQAVREHVRHYDHPAHYLRITVAFKSAFWRNSLSGSFFMIEAFGGACVYDESSRHPEASDAVLSWLLAGDAAMTFGNLCEAELLSAVLGSLPAQIRPDKNQVIEAQVHRWMGAVNAWPMGAPIREPDSRHMPDELGHPEFYIVGDYLFDSTVNGVMDSADTVAQLMLDVNMDDQNPNASQTTVRGDDQMTQSGRYVQYVGTPAAEGTYLRHFEHPDTEYASEIVAPAEGAVFNGLKLTTGPEDKAAKSVPSQITVMQGGITVHWSPNAAHIAASAEKAEQFVPAVMDFDHLQRERAQFENLLSRYEAQAKADVKLTYATERNRGVDRQRLMEVMEELARQRLRMARCLPLAEIAQADLSEAGRRLYKQLCEKAEIGPRLNIASDRMEALEDLYEGAIDRNNDLQAWKKSNGMEVAIIVLLLVETMLVLAQIMGVRLGSWHF